MSHKSHSPRTSSPTARIVVSREERTWHGPGPGWEVRKGFFDPGPAILGIAGTYGISSADPGSGSMVTPSGKSTLAVA